MVEDVSPQPPGALSYLGDGLYAEFDGFQIRLVASDGERVLNEVFLEPDVFYALLNYAQGIGFATGDERKRNV